MTNFKLFNFCFRIRLRRKQILSVSLRVTREGEEVIIPVNITVRDIDEPPLILTNIENSYSEDLAVGSKLTDVLATDPENQEEFI